MKAELLDLLRYVETVHREFIATVDPIGATEPGTWELWSGKDNLAHIVYWLQWRNRELTAMLNHDEASAPVTDNGRDYNREIFADFKDTPWATIRANWETEYALSLDLVAKLSEDQLTQPGVAAWLNNGKLWPRMVNNSYSHPISHFNGYYIQHNLPDRALKVQSDMLDRLDTFAEGELRHIGVYDLACIYAKTGNADQALTLLSQAFALDASLRTWATQDPDLVSLRELVNFQALTTA